MPARPRTALKAAASAPAAPLGTFARLQQQADQRRKPIEPYVIDDIDPPIVIQAPTSIEQQVGLAELFFNDGDFQTRDARRVLELLCGDAFPDLWAHIRGKHISFLVALIKDMGEHFGGLLGVWDEEDHPGGSGASSS